MKQGACVLKLVGGCLVSKRSLVVVAVAAAVAAACLTGAPAAMAKKKITWWAGGDALFKILKTEFEKGHKNVEVNIITGDVDKFYTMITAGLMPDVWGPWSTPGIQADVNRNWALDITPYLKRDAKEVDVADFFPGVMRQFKVGGKQFSLPAYMNIDYFYYNTGLWAEAGLVPPPFDSKDKSWSWDMMVEAALKTTKRDSANRLTQQGLALTVGWFDIPSWFHLWGAQPYSADAFKTSVPQKMHFSTPEMVKAFTKVQELKTRYNVIGSNFVGGKTAASFENGYMVYSVVAAKKLKWAIRNLPWAETNSGTLWPNGWRIAKVSKSKDTAWEFVKFLCSREGLRIAGADPKSHMQFTAPMRKSVFQETLGKNVGNATGMNPADVYRVAAQADDVGVVKYQESICLHVDMDRFLNPVLQDMWNNKMTPQATAAKLQDIADKRLPELFKRWMRNIKFTGADKNYDADALPTQKGGLI